MKRSTFSTIAQAALFATVIVCTTVHLTAAVADRLGPGTGDNLVLISLIVSLILAPPASFILALFTANHLKVQAQLEQLANTDQLTGLHNRRAFEAAYERERERMGRLGDTMSLLLFDVDHFKAINTAHGHNGGDEALRQLAKALTRSIRSSTDEVARWGGEEFVVLLPHTGADSLDAAARRFHRLLGETQLTLGKEKVRLTVSIGGVTCRTNERLEHSVARADDCMQEAKRCGRNRYVVNVARAANDVEAA